MFYIGDIVGSNKNRVWNKPYMHYIRYQFKIDDNRYHLCLNFIYKLGVFKTDDLYKK